MTWVKYFTVKTTYFIQKLIFLLIIQKYIWKSKDNT